jgi:hypothetical protein
MYDPGHRLDQDAQYIPCASDTQKQPENNCANQDLFLEFVLDVAVIVDVLEDCPDEACREECEWGRPQHTLRQKRCLMLTFVSKVLESSWQHLNYPQRMEFQAAAPLEQTPCHGVVAHDEHANWIQQQHPSNASHQSKSCHAVATSLLLRTILLTGLEIERLFLVLSCLLQVAR